MNNLTPVVDAGRPGYKDMLTITIFDSHATLERHAILIGRVQVRRRIKITDLSFPQALHRISVHLNQHFRIGMPSSNARTGDIVRLLRQSLRDKSLPTRLNHTGIIHVDILYEKPGTYAILRQLTALFQKTHDVIIHQETSLIFRVDRLIESASQPIMSIASMRDFPQSSFSSLRDHPGLQIGPHGHLRSI